MLSKRRILVLEICLIGDYAQLPYELFLVYLKILLFPQRPLLFWFGDFIKLSQLVYCCQYSILLYVLLFGCVLCAERCHLYLFQSLVCQGISGLPYITAISLPDIPTCPGIQAIFKCFLILRIVMSFWSFKSFWSLTVDRLSVKTTVFALSCTSFIALRIAELKN